MHKLKNKQKAKQRFEQHKKLKVRSPLIKQQVINKSIFSVGSMSNTANNSNLGNNTFLNGSANNIHATTLNSSSSFSGNITNNVAFQTLRNRKTNKSSVPLDERISLEKAFGFTIQSNTRISQSCDGTIAYLAGCVIVLYDCNDLMHQEFIISPAKKTLTCVAFSNDGRTIATGESGHDPKLRVWDVREKIQLCEFSGHKFSIDCVHFSPNNNSNLLVSVGSMHDMVVNVWNYKTKFKVASNKIACKVKGIAFSRDGSYFVTVGNRHVKFWYLTVSSLMETVPLRGRAAILGDMKNNYFCDVVCGNGDNAHLTYAITTNGVLCEFNEARCLNQVAELHVERAYCIYSDDCNLFIGCSNGTILIFRQKILDCIGSISRPHYLGVDISRGLDTSHVTENMNNPEIKHPDCIALCYDKYDFILSAFYNDHSFYVWDIRNLNQIKKVDSHLFHSSSCGSIDSFTNNNIMLPDMPMDAFITCSSDNTVRIWSMTNATQSKSKLRRNIYSKELLKIIYIDGDLSALCENDQSVDISDPATNASTANSSQVISKGSTDPTQNSETKFGARCIKISPHGKHLATGDRNGNLRIYDLSTLESICMIEAHMAEVLDLQYSPPESGRQLLASSSRDRLIHIFDASKPTYDLLQTIDDHSAAITAVRFCFNSLENQLLIISCGADKSIMFRTSHLETNKSSTSPSSHSPNNQSHSSLEYTSFVRTSYVAEKQTFHDLNVDPNRQLLNTISQDRMIREYSIKDGKKVRQFKGSLNEDGYLIKMDIDRNGQFLATACTDKLVYIWDLKTTECLAYFYGHSETVNDLKFTADGQNLITVGADGCLFLWRISNLYTYLSNNTSITPVTNKSNLRASVPNFQTTTITTAPNTTTQVPLMSSSAKLSMETIFDNDNNDSLPAWARKKLESNPICTTAITKTTSTVVRSASTNASSWSTENEQSYSCRSSGRAVWGPPLNTSFAIAVDSELSSMASMTSQSEQITDNKNTTPENLKNFKHSLIEFPSPCINKESYQVKKVSIDDQTKGNNNQRPSWICSNNEDDLIFNLNRLNPDDSSSDDTSTSPLKTDGHDIQENIEIVSTVTTQNIESTTTDMEAIISEQINDINFNSDYSQILNNISPSLTTPVRRTLPANKQCFSLADNFIKLDCDMENSFRRQSISARYLLRTAQQKEQSTLKDETHSLPQFTPNFKNINKIEEKENLSDALNQINKSQIRAETPKMQQLEETMLLSSPSTPKAPISVETVNVPQSSAETVKPRTRTHRNSTSSNFQLLYSQHTESSLNKAKPKQPQGFHSTNNLSKDESNKSTSNSQQMLKRSPSVSSINVQSQECNKSSSQDSASSSLTSSSTSSTSSSTSSSGNKHTNKSISAKNSPIKQSTNFSRSNNLEPQSTVDKSRTTPTNLKKAISMISLISSQASTKQRASTTTTSTTTTRKDTIPTKDNANVFLPPKTVRQIKHRSTDRQLNNSTSHQSSFTSNISKSTNLSSVNTFTEQNKHLRKLSTSIQNLHHSQQASKNLLPPPVPQKQQQQIVKSETDEEKLLKIANEKAKKANESSVNEQELIDKLKKIDTDEMSVSSSSVECLEVGNQNEHHHHHHHHHHHLLDHDQQHLSSHTTNSLTSSSSSSCSLFESNAGLIIPNTSECNYNDEQPQKDEPNKKSFNHKNSDTNNKTLGSIYKKLNDSRCSESSSPSQKSNILKKPVTFATLAANSPKILTKSANNSPNVINYSQPSKFNTNNIKNDSIRSEFIHNFKNLQFFLSQGSQNLDDFIQYQQSTQQSKPLINDQTCQQLQLQFNTFINKLTAVVHSNKTTTSTSNNNSNNSKTKSKNNNNEIELA